MRKLFRDYEVHHRTVQIMFSITFSLSCTLFELIIFEILNTFDEYSKLFFWRTALMLMIWFLIFFLPFLMCYLLAKNVFRFYQGSKSGSTKQHSQLTCNRR